MENPNAHATNDNQNPWTAFSDIAFNAQIRNAVLFLTGKESSAAVSAEFADPGGRFAGLEMDSPDAQANVTASSVSPEVGIKPEVGRDLVRTPGETELAATAGAGLGAKFRPRSLSTSLERVDVGIPKFLMIAPGDQEAASNG